MTGRAAEWGDNDILGATQQEFNEAGTHKRFKLNLGDGSEPITSEYMDPSAIKARTLIDWCEAVRAVIAARREAEDQDRAAKRARRKAGLATDSTSESAIEPMSAVSADVSAATPATAPPAPPTVREPDSNDPVAYARANLEAAQSRLSQLQTQAKDVLEQIKLTKAATDKWAIIVSQLENI